MRDDEVPPEPPLISALATALCTAAIIGGAALTTWVIFRSDAWLDAVLSAVGAICAVTAFALAHEVVVMARDECDAKDRVRAAVLTGNMAIFREKQTHAALLRDIRNDSMLAVERVFEQNTRLLVERDHLLEKLLPFTAQRERDAAGRFISTKPKALKSPTLMLPGSPTPQEVCDVP